MAVSYIAILICISATFIDFISADTGCKVPFQPYSKQPGTCYAKLPKHKCDWIQGTYFNNNCFVTEEHNYAYSSKFFCDFGESFRHCADRPGFCCMQSTKFECDKYAFVEYNETLGTCMAPVSGFHERTDDDVTCPEHFHYNNTQRQCEADVTTEDKHEITEEDCKNVGGHINGTKCYVDPETVIPTPGPCEDVNDEGCEPPPPPTRQPPTGQTTPRKSPNTSDTTTVTPSTTSNLPTTLTTTTAPISTTKSPNITVSTQGPNGTSYGTSSGYPTTTTNPTPTTSSPNATESTGSTSFTTSGSTSSGTVIPTTPTTPTTSSDSTSGTVTTQTSPPTDSTSPTTPYLPSSTTDSNNSTASTGATPSGSPYTQSETVTSTTPSTTTTTGTTASPPTSISPYPSSTSPSPTSSPPPPYFNISHSCPVGFMISPHQCIGVWTSDCESKHGGIQHEEACLISFDNTGKRVKRTEDESVTSGDTVVPLPTTLTPLLSTVTETVTTTTTTSKPTTTTKPPPKPTTTKKPPVPQCRDNIPSRHCRQLVRDGICNDAGKRPEMYKRCRKSCGWCNQ